MDAGNVCSTSHSRVISNIKKQVLIGVLQYFSASKKQTRLNNVPYNSKHFKNIAWWGWEKAAALH